MNGNYYKYKKDIVTGAITMAVAIAAFVLTLDMPGTAPTFPRIAATALFLLGLFLLVTSLVKRKRRVPPVEEELDYHPMINAAYVLILLIVYVFGISFLGFYVTTFLALVGYMWLFGVRKFKPLVITTVSVMLLVYLVFTVGLNIPLPKGLLI